MPVIDIQDVGLVEFPDGMTEVELSAAAKSAYDQFTAGRPDPTTGRMPSDFGGGPSPIGFKADLGEPTLPGGDMGVPRESGPEPVSAPPALANLGSKLVSMLAGAGEQTRMAPGFSITTEDITRPMGKIPTPSAQDWQGFAESLMRGGTQAELGTFPTSPGARAMADSPALDPTAAEMPAGTAAKVASGVNQSVAQMAEFFTSPLGVATLGMGVLPKAAQRAVSGYFAYTMAHGAPEVAAQLGTAIESGDTEQIAKSTADALQTLGFTAGAGLHAVGPGKPTPAMLIARDMERAAKEQPSLPPPSREALQRLKDAGLPETAKALFPQEGTPLEVKEGMVTDKATGKPAEFTVPPEGATRENPSEIQPQARPEAVQGETAPVAEAMPPSKGADQPLAKGPGIAVPEAPRPAGRAETPEGGVETPPVEKSAPAPTNAPGEPFPAKEPPAAPATIKVRDFDRKGRLEKEVEMDVDEAAKKLRARESMLKSLLDCLGKLAA